MGTVLLWILGILLGIVLLALVIVLVLLCPFVAGYIHKHPEWKRIVMRGIHIK